ncbi:MAG: sigma factor, partial [Pseudomonadota bacterium]
MARKASKPLRPKRRSVAAEPVETGADAEPIAHAEKLNPAADAQEDLSADTDNDGGIEPATIEISDFHPLEDTSATTGSDDGASADDAPEPASKDGAGSALVSVDPLTRYLTDVRRFSLLTREEETTIAKRYATGHDPADAYRLVTANLRLVVKIAFEFARASRNVLDLIQEGNVGLMEAVKNFDPYRGIRFPSYAVWW